MQEKKTEVMVDIFECIGFIFLYLVALLLVYNYCLETFLSSFMDPLHHSFEILTHYSLQMSFIH